MRKKVERERFDKHTALRMTDAMYAEVDRLSYGDGITIGTFIRSAIRKYVKERTGKDIR